MLLFPTPPPLPRHHLLLLRKHRHLLLRYGAQPIHPRHPLLRPQPPSASPASPAMPSLPSVAPVASPLGAPVRVPSLQFFSTVHHLRPLFCLLVTMILSLITWHPTPPPVDPCFHTYSPSSNLLLHAFPIPFQASIHIAFPVPSCRTDPLLRAPSPSPPLIRSLVAPPTPTDHGYLVPPPFAHATVLLLCQLYHLNQRPTPYSLPSRHHPPCPPTFLTPSLRPPPHPPPLSSHHRSIQIFSSDSSYACLVITSSISLHSAHTHSPFPPTPTEHRHPVSTNACTSSLPFRMPILATSPGIHISYYFAVCFYHLSFFYQISPTMAKRVYALPLPYGPRITATLRFIKFRRDHPVRPPRTPLKIGHINPRPGYATVGHILPVSTIAGPLKLPRQTAPASHSYDFNPLRLCLWFRSSPPLFVGRPPYLASRILWRPTPLLTWSPRHPAAHLGILASSSAATPWSVPCKLSHQPYAAPLIRSNTPLLG